MHNKKKARILPIADINVVPYIDVMLVLLVIFMITAPMLTQGVTVDLPQAMTETIKSSDREPIIVSVNKNGEYFLNINSNPTEVISTKNLMVRVAAELTLAKETKTDLPVLVKGDKGVAYGKVVQVMSLLKQSGASQVGLLTDTPNNNGDRA